MSQREKILVNESGILGLSICENVAVIFFTFQLFKLESVDRKWLNTFFNLPAFLQLMYLMERLRKCGFISQVLCALICIVAEKNVKSYL